MARISAGIKTGRLIVSLFALAAVGALVWGQAPPPEPDLSAPTSAPAQPAPAAPPAVVVEGRRLFAVQTNLGPFTAQERAAATSDRLTRVAKDLTASVDAIAAVPSDTSTDIVLGDRILLTVTDADATAAGKSRAALVADDIRSIRSAVAAVRTEFSSRSLLEGALYTVLATALLIALIMLLSRVLSAVVAKLQRANIHSVRLQRVELISAQQIKNVLIRATKTLRFLVVLTAFYIYVPSVLSFFPWTRGYAPKIIDYILMPLRSAGQAVLAYLPSLFVVIICGIGAYLLIRASHFLFRELGSGTITWPGFYREWSEPTHKILRFLILAITLVVVFPYLPGSDSPAFRGISIFLGVLFSLGSTSAIANIIGGVILTYTRAFTTGDRVKIGDTTGDVMEKTLLATRIRTIKNEFITVPNSIVLSSHIVNYSSPYGGGPLILHTSVTIGYDTPWRTVHDLLTAAALRTTRILKEPAPFVLQTSLDDYYVSYQINAYTSEASSMAVTYGELHQNIQDCFNESEVEIMSPHYTALRDGNYTSIPEEYRPKGYSPGSFRIEQKHKEDSSGTSGGAR